MDIKIRTKTLMSIFFYIMVTATIVLHFIEDTYTLKQLSFNIQSTMLLIALLFYKEEN
jgi:hypothetical protein